MCFKLVAQVASVWVSLTVVVCLAGVEPLTIDDIQALIGQLGSKQFKLRESAEQELLQHPEAIPLLRAAQKSEDKEVARRAAQIIAEMERRTIRAGLDRLKALGKSGEIDVLVEQLVLRPEWDWAQDDAFQVLSDLAGKLLDAETEKYHCLTFEKPRGSDDRWARIASRCEPPFRDFLRFKRSLLPPEFISSQATIKRESGSRCVIRSQEVELAKAAQAVIVATGRVRAGDLGFSTLFAGDSVYDVERLTLAVVVCDGEFKCKESTGGRWMESIVIARGDVYCPQGMDNSLIISSGRVHIPKTAFPYRNSVIKENVVVPLDYVKFFDPVREGVEVVPNPVGVKVKTVAENKRFARAGLKPDDCILAIDGAESQSPDAFRRLLRRKFAEGGVAPFEVARGEKTVTLSVSFKP
jgi:hypothetical protein